MRGRLITGRFSTRPMTRVYVAKSRIAGNGCFAARDLEEGEEVGEYRGEIIDENEADRRYDGRDETYLFDIGDGMLIDAEPYEDAIKYINHSCEPNCESYQIGKRIVVRTLRAIRKGEELTYDYNLDEERECHCGTAQCRGTMSKPH